MAVRLGEPADPMLPTASFDRMSLFNRVPLEPNGEYYVRVRAHTTPRNAGFIWPWQGDDFVGFAKFTFLR